MDGTAKDPSDVDCQVQPPADTPARAGSGGFVLLAPVKARLFVVVGLGILASLATVAPFVGIVEIVRSLAVGDGPSSRVWTITAGVIVAVVLRSAAIGVAGLLSHSADNDLQLDLRRAIVAHIRRMPLGRLAEEQSAGVVKVVEHDVDIMHQLVGHSVQDITLGVGVPVIALGYLLTSNRVMAGAAMIPVVAAMVLMMLMMRATVRSKQDYDQAVVGLDASVVDFVQGIAVVKAFGEPETTYRAYQRSVVDFVTAWTTWIRATRGYLIITEVITSPVITLLILVVCAQWLISGGTSWLDVLPGLVLGLGLAAPIFQLATSAEAVMNARKAHDAIAALLAEPVIAQPSVPKQPDGSDVGVSRVCFSYTDGHQVLHQINLRCLAGTVTALVGPSGSGKSTLARLIPRFYDPDSGVITLGGEDLRDIAEDDLYSTTAMVFQEPHLLQASVRENICLTRPDCPESEMIAAARAAQIHDTIMSYPSGYDSVIGVDTHVSGGEAQRISIARALVGDAPVLVLDEATAFADPDSEALIQKAISALTQTRSVIVIAHRLHTIVNADTIVVLDHGRVVEQGTHRDLVRAGGLYATLWANYQDVRGVGR